MKNVGQDLHPLDVGWEDEPAGPAYLFRILRRQFLVLLLCPLLFLLLGLAYVVVATPLYTASASIHVRVGDPALSEETTVLDTHVELIQSDRVVSSVVEELGLDAYLDPTPGRLRRAIVDLRQWLEVEAGDYWSGVDERFFVISQVRSGLDVQRVGNTSIIAVRYTSPDRAYSVELANAFADIYVRDVNDAAGRSAERRIDLLRRRAEEVRGLAVSADKAAQRILSESDFMVTSPEDLEARIAVFRQRLSTVNTDEAETRTRLSLVSQAEDLKSLEAAARHTDETLKIYSEMMSASSKLAQLREQPGVSQNTIQRLEESVAEMRTSLEQAVQRIRDELELNLAVTKAQRSSLLRELNDILEYGRSQAWFDLLEARRSAEIYKGIHQVYLNELETEIRRGADGDVRLASAARPPVNPTFPNYKVVLVLAVMIGVMAGGGLAMFREWTRSYARMQAWRAGRRGRPLGA